eukprot:SAG22_NODE_17_length_32684_cov_34.234095_8_plen_587_part_00
MITICEVEVFEASGRESDAAGARPTVSESYAGLSVSGGSFSIDAASTVVLGGVVRFEDATAVQLQGKKLAAETELHIAGTDVTLTRCTIVDGSSISVSDGGSLVIQAGSARITGLAVTDASFSMDAASTGALSGELRFDNAEAVTLLDQTLVAAAYIQVSGGSSLSLQRATGSVSGLQVDSSSFSLDASSTVSLSGAVAVAGAGSVCILAGCTIADSASLAVSDGGQLTIIGGEIGAQFEVGGGTLSLQGVSISASVLAGVTAVNVAGSEVQLRAVSVTEHPEWGLLAGTVTIGADSLSTSADGALQQVLGMLPGTFVVRSGPCTVSDGGRCVGQPHGYNAHDTCEIGVAGSGGLLELCAPSALGSNGAVLVWGDGPRFNVGGYGDMNDWLIMNGRWYNWCTQCFDATPDVAGAMSCDPARRTDGGFYARLRGNSDFDGQMNDCYQPPHNPHQCAGERVSLQGGGTVSWASDPDYSYGHHGGWEICFERQGLVDGSVAPPPPPPRPLPTDADCTFVPGDISGGYANAGGAATPAQCAAIVKRDHPTATGASFHGHHCIARFGTEVNEGTWVSCLFNGGGDNGGGGR